MECAMSDEVGPDHRPLPPFPEEFYDLPDEELAISARTWSIAHRLQSMNITVDMMADPERMRDELIARFGIDAPSGWRQPISSHVTASLRRRGPGRPFPKGVSGNPAGKKRHEVNVQALARTFTEAAVLTLVECLADPKHKVAAAVALLDRGWGRPTQHIAGDEDRPAAIVFSWAPATPEPQPQAAPVIDAATSTDDTHSSAPLTLVWDGQETC
jgi:hypothetical protein